MKIDISFVIPCYCSEKNLESVVTEISTAISQRQGFSYEIILVNDNSKDGTRQLIDRMCEEDHRIKGIHFTKNFGQPAALLAGFRAARGDYIVTSDDDGQTPIGMVWTFFDKINEGYDVVCAKYNSRPQKSIVRKLGTKVNEWMLQHFLQKPKDIGMSSFFMARHSIIDEIIRYGGPYPYMAGLLLRSTSKIANISLDQRERRAGQSGYRFSKLVKTWLNGFTTFSIKPLHIVCFLGGLCSLIGAFVLIALAIRKIVVSTSVVGLHVQTGILLLMSGLILLVLGLIAEYIGRIYMTINGNPQYVISYCTDYEEDDGNSHNKE